MKTVENFNLSINLGDQLSNEDLLVIKGGSTSDTNKVCPINNVEQCGCTVNTVAGCACNRDSGCGK